MLQNTFLQIKYFFPKKCSKDFKLMEWFPASSDSNLIENFSSLKAMCMRIENNVHAEKRCLRRRRKIAVNRNARKINKKQKNKKKQ